MKLNYLLLVPIHWYVLWASLTPICLTVMPPKPYRKYISGLILFPILIYTQFIYTIDHNDENAPIALSIQGILLILFFQTFNLFFIVEYPDLTDYRPEVETLDYVRSLKPFTLEKLKWCFHRSFIGNLQGNGWNWQIGMKGVKQRNELSNKKKEKTNLKLWLKNLPINKILIKYTIYDILYHLFISTEYVKSKGWGYGHTKDLVLFSKESQLAPIKQLFLAFSSAYIIYVGIETVYNVTAFINIFIFSIHNIDEYPELFGSFNNEYTIKSLWRNLWHKLMYQLSVPQSKYLSGCDYKAKHLNVLPRYGTEVWRTYLMYFFVFAFTGLFHAASILNMPWSRGEGYNVNVPNFAVKYLPKWCTRCFYSFVFFPAQFLLISVETVVQKLYKEHIEKNIRIPHKIRMIIGLVWIALLEAYLLQMYMDEIIKSGYDIEELVIPFTPVHYVFQKFRFKL